MSVIGFVGLDQLSLQLASSLLRSGYAVQAFEDVVALVVLISHADQINDLRFGHESALKGLRKDAVIILHSTILPAHIQKLEKRLTAEDLERIFIISSGQSDAITRARPVLSAMSEKLYVFEGALGAGSKIKMVIELLEGIHFVSSVEAISLGAQAGIHPWIIYDIISNAAGNSCRYCVTLLLDILLLDSILQGPQFLHLNVEVKPYLLHPFLSSGCISRFIMDPFGCTKFELKLEDDEVCGNKEELGSHANDPIQSLTKNDVLEMQFNSEEDANDFYNQYAKVVGFSIRKDTRTMQATKVLSRKWVCSRQGQRAKQHLARIDRKRAARALTRVGCDAHFHIRYNLDVGKYIVTHFNMEHDHPLATSPCVPFLRSHRFVKIPDKAQVKNLHDVGVMTSQIMDLLVQQSGSFANVGFIHKDLHNYIQAERKLEMKDGDAECALTYLCAKADADPYFFYKYDKDQENRLDKLFWADSRSRLDYAAFGDVLVFNTTYKMNAYNKPFVIFAGVNNHFETTIFACSLLVDETIATYTWVLQKLLEAMDNKRPVSMLTDGDMAMREAIQKVFSSAKHHLCNWHMHRNAQQNVRVDGFEGHFKHLMDVDANEVVFEEAWSKMVKKYGLQNNKWVSDTYNNKGMWAQSYLRGHFSAGMKSSQRCEGMHAFFNERLKRKLKLFKFVRCFDMALYRLRNKEADAGAKTGNSDPCLTTTLQPLEKHAATIFTRRLFLMFRNEIIEEALLIFDGRKEEFDHRIYKFSKYTEFGSTWEVSYHPATSIMKCSCKKFKFFGFPCSHMISVMKCEHITEIPPSCVMHRWTKQARKVGEPYCEAQFSSTFTQETRFGVLCSSFTEMCYCASQTSKGFEEARNAFFTMTCRMKQLCMAKGTNVDEGKSSLPPFGVGDPKVVNTKGNTGGSYTAKPRKPRQCQCCRVVGHTWRTCPQNDHKTGQVGSNLFEEYDDYDLIGTPTPFTPRRPRNNMRPCKTHPVKRRLFVIKVDTSPVQLSKDVNDLRSCDAQVVQNSAFTDADTSLECCCG
ncbi:unnamed protein product [Camellia sinensis]